MEPERQIEKLLRAYAKKRRAGKGGAFKLEPWTRRRLQDEVAKQFAEFEEESLSLWQLFKRQWALLIGFALVMFLGASLFVPALNGAKTKAKNVATISQLKQIGVAVQLAAADNNGRLPATLDALTNGFVNRDVLDDPVSGKPFVYAAGGNVLNDLQTNAVLAYSASDGKARAVLLADGSVQMMNEEMFLAANQRFPALTGDTLIAAQTQPVPAATQAMPMETFELANSNKAADGDAGVEIAVAKAPAIASARNFRAARSQAAPAAADTMAASATMFSQAFSKAEASNNGTLFALSDDNTNNVQRFKLVLDKAAIPPSVLNTFEVRRNGSMFAVVDYDGSIYNGSIEPESLVAQIAATDMTLTTASAGKNLKTRSTTLGNLSFRVTGQNQTLKQTVVFAGSIMADTNNLTQQGFFSNAHIAGTATIGETNKIQIIAQSVTP